MNSYEIIICLEGKHFATIDLKTMDEKVAISKYIIVSDKFMGECWSLTMMEWTLPSGRVLATDDENNIG